MAYPRSVLAILLGMGGAASITMAQENPISRQEFEQFQRDLEAWKQRQEEAVDDLEFEVETSRPESLSAPPAQPLASNVFNPQITLFGNFLGRMDDRKVVNEDGDRLDDRFHLREIEADFRAAIDPWADGVVILSFESEVPGEYSATVEEAYFTLKKIPLLDSAPLGAKIKVGRFRASFGRFNRIHLHDLPQVNYPGSLAEYLGEEGLAREGISAQFLLPSPGDDMALQATVEVINGGGVPIAEANGGNDPAFVSRLSAFVDIAPGQTLEVGGSSWLGASDARGKRQAHLAGADVTYQWRPLLGETAHSFLIGGELFVASLEQPRGRRHTPLGWFAYAQAQLTQNTYLGARYDAHDAVVDESVQTQTVGGYLTYYTTEFLRTRLAYEHARSDDPATHGRDSVFVEFNFIFGSHPVEPYWVNR